jgi:hypothetical protein
VPGTLSEYARDANLHSRRLACVQNADYCNLKDAVSVGKGCRHGTEIRVQEVRAEVILFLLDHSSAAKYNVS